MYCFSFILCVTIYVYWSNVYACLATYLCFVIYYGVIGGKNMTATITLSSPLLMLTVLKPEHLNNETITHRELLYCHASNFKLNSYLYIAAT